MSAPAIPRILLVACADKPAAAIEWALAWSRDERQCPHELHVLASVPAARRIQRDLLSDDTRTGGLAAICRRVVLNRNDIVFNARTLHVLASTAESSTARTVEDTCDLLRRLCYGLDSALTAIVSSDAAIAGVAIHAGLQLFGRPADRLLVSVRPDLNRHRRCDRPQALRSRTPQSPYIEMPILLASEAGLDAKSYRQLVERRRRERRRLVDPEPLALNCRARHATIGDTVIRLSPRRFFWLCVLAKSAGATFPLAELSNALHVDHTGHIALSAPAETDNLKSLIASLRRTYTALFPHCADDFGVMLRRACGPDPGLPSTISKINSALREALGPGALPYLIEGGRQRGGYRLRLDPRLIVIEM